MNIFSHERFQKIFALVRAHKIMSTLVVAIVLAGGYYEYRSLTSTVGETRYVLAATEKGTIISSITGSGQVSAFNQIDLKPKASGDVIYVGVANGQEVAAGTLIAQLDASDAQKAVRDAEVNLASTKLSLDKILQPADALSLLQTENALSQATSDLSKSYDNGFNSVSNTFLNLPTIMTGMQDILYGTTINRSQDNLSAYTDMVKDYDDRILLFKDDAATKYQKARDMYNQSFIDYRSLSRLSSRDDIEKMVAETYETTRSIAEAVKSTNDMLGFVKDRLVERSKNVPSALTTHQNLLATYTGQTNSSLIDLLAIQNTITTSKYSIAEKTESLSKLKAGADTLDIQSSQLSLKQRENALLDAQENLSHYFVRAPFAGTIAKLDVKKGDPISASTVVATLITKQMIAQISLNEVDAAKVKVGQKATLTFDAVDGLTIAGDVAEIDTVGTVSQGVVTYMVKIAFKTQDDRVKSGMSTSAAIITDMKQDVLTVPNSAVKTQGGASYVEVFDIPLVAPVTTSTTNVANTGIPSVVLPRKQTVEIGLSNDTMTEIVSGLIEGQQIVSRTIIAIAATATQAPSLLNAAGVRTGGSGATRAVTGR